MPPYVGIAILMRKFLFGICCKIAGGAHLSGLIGCAPSFFLFVLDFFLCAALWGLLFCLFSTTDFVPLVWRFRLCGGDGGSSPLDPRKPSGGGLDPPLFISRHSFVLAFLFAPLRLFFVFLFSDY